MTDVVTRLVVRADGSLATLDRFEKGMGDAGRATDYASGAVASFEQRMAAARVATERGLAVSTQSVARKTQEQRAWEKWSATVDRTTGLRIRLEREAATAAAAAANAVNLGYASQEQALTTLVALEQRHAAQLSQHIAAENNVAVAYNRTAQAADQAAVSIGRMNAANSNRSMGASNFNTGNVAAQFQDIGVTAAMGMSPIMIALQQGTQLSAVLGGQGLTGVVKTLGGAFASILSPVSLLTIGVVALAAWGIQAFMNMAGGAEEASDALERHNDELDRILAGYDQARDAAQGFNDEASRRPEGAVASDLIAGREESAVNLRSSYDALYEEQQRIIASFGDLAYSGDVATIELVRGFGEVAISAGTSSQELDAMLVSLTQVANNNDYTAKVRKYATDMLPFIEAVIRGRNEVGSFDTALRMLPKEVNIRLNMQRATAEAHSDLLNLYQDPRSSFDVMREQASMRAEAASSTAMSYSQAAQIGEDYLRVIESIDAAEALAASKAGAKGAAAAAKPFDQWSGNVDSFQQRIASQRMELDLMGQSTYEVERQKAAFDLLNQAKAAGIPITSQVTDEINLMSAEYAAATVELENAAKAQAAMEEQLNFYRSTFTGFFGDLKSGLQEGQSFWEALGNAGANALDKIADRALSMAANGIFDMIFGAVMGGITGGLGGGMGGGVFGTSAITGSSGGFFPGFADGTNYAPGGLAWVGERGRELVNLPRGSQVIPNGPSMAVAANSNASMGDIYITNNMQVMPGATEEDGAAFARGVSRELRKQLPDAIQSYNRNPLRRAS